MIDKDFKLLLEVIAGVIGRINDLSLRVETCRLLLREHGVADEEFDLVYGQLKRSWDAQSDATLGQMSDELTAERLHRLLDSAGGTKQ